MKRISYIVALGFFFSIVLMARAEVLIVADEFPVMQFLADKLKAEENTGAQVIPQTNLPTNLEEFSAVVVYIHGELSTNAADAFIDYATSGGRLVLLHHSIDSAKRKNTNWLAFLGVSLPTGDLARGGYQWIEPANWSLVNLNPRSFIMTNKVTYPESIAYYSARIPTPAGHLRGYSLTNSEVYLNHTLTGAHTLLMGLKYSDPKSGVTYMQDRAGWLRPAGSGVVVYLMPGHTKGDFENPVYGRIVLNAITSPLDQLKK